MDAIHELLYEKYSMSSKYFHYSGKWGVIHLPDYVAWGELRELHIGFIKQFFGTKIKLPRLVVLTCSASHLRILAAPALTNLTIKGRGIGDIRLTECIRNFPLLEYADFDIPASQELLDVLNAMPCLRYIWIHIKSVFDDGETNLTPIVLPSIPMSLMIHSNTRVLLSEYVEELGENCSFDLSAATKLKRLICCRNCHVVNAPRTLQSVFCLQHYPDSKMARHFFRPAPRGVISDLPHENFTQWACNVQFEMRRHTLYIDKIRCSGHCTNFANAKRVIDAGDIIRYMF
jgi:hypothetical protein